MENQASSPDQYSQSAAPENANLFNDVFDLAPYEKSMRNARIWLYVIAGIQFLVGIFEYSTVPDKTVGAIAFGIDAGVALVFLVLALWSKKAPTVAFTIALVFYAVVVLAAMFLDASNIYRGIILKILVVIALVKANRDARKYEEAKRALGEQ